MRWCLRYALKTIRDLILAVLDEDLLLFHRVSSPRAGNARWNVRKGNGTSLAGHWPEGRWDQEKPSDNHRGSQRRGYATEGWNAERRHWDISARIGPSKVQQWKSAAAENLRWNAGTSTAGWSRRWIRCLIIIIKMFSCYYKSFKSPSNIYSIDKYKDPRYGDRQCWLIVTMKELYTLRGSDDESGEVICELVHDPQSKLGKYVSLTFQKVSIMSLARLSTWEANQSLRNWGPHQLLNLLSILRLRPHPLCG